jgi:hypothetical protein
MTKPAEKKCMICIFKDITRTFTKHVYFKDKFGKGQGTLFNVLKGISIEEKESGYV